MLKNRRLKRGRDEKMRTAKERGITLIALIVTIIVLLILAGVTIATLTGDNGILTKATEAKDKTEEGEEEEKVKLSAVGALAKENGEGISQDNLEEELGEYFDSADFNLEPGTSETGEEGYIVTIKENNEEGNTYFVSKDGRVGEYIVREPAEPTLGIGANFDMSNGVIEVKFLDGTSYNTTDTPNHPILKEGMIAITYNESTGEIRNVSNSEETDWYSYVAGSGTSDNNASHWANAKVTVDNVDSYFVWIPRYAYRIIYFDSVDSANEYRAGTLTEEQALAENKVEGYSDARGIVDTEGKTKEGVSVQTAISVDDKYFKTHPVFDGDVNYGGWAEDDGTPVKLQGFWVAKYESAHSDTVGMTQGNSTKIKSVPGVSSWRNSTIGDIFTHSKNYNITLNSHLMKNSEWGAVAYLTESRYGRNGTEVAINNSSSYITGMSGGRAGASSTDKTYEYNTSNGVLASTTANVYGIYDLSGGSTEYIASYNKDGSALDNGSSFTTSRISNKYSMVYEGVNITNGYKYGDATYETNGWKEDENKFILSSNEAFLEYPFFIRGGDCNNSVGAGIFCFNGNSGCISDKNGFRICLSVQ